MKVRLKSFSFLNVISFKLISITDLPGAAEHWYLSALCWPSNAGRTGNCQQVMALSSPAAVHVSAQLCSLGTEDQRMGHTCTNDDVTLKLRCEEKYNVPSVLLCSPVYYHLNMLAALYTLI